MDCATRRIAQLLTVLSVALAGCMPKYANEPLQTYDAQAGYRPGNLRAQDNNSNSTMVLMSFSGGGTRAAALAYGVLMGLRDVELPVSAEQPPRTLLDELDGISSVSGGSFTALGYALWGEDLFSGHYEQSFLRHNVQGDLLLAGLNPLNLGANKSILAARYYDKHIFRGSTYQDLLARGQRPFISVNATDMARQEQFRFLQDTFDFLGSDLSKLPLAWAAASSSAFPVLLDPLRFKYYPGPAMVSAIRKELEKKEFGRHPTHRLWARDLIDRDLYDQSNEIKLNKQDHRYLYLLDGGVVDNLGLTPLFSAMKYGFLSKLINAGQIDRFVVIIVDAGTYKPSHIERSARKPSGLFVGVETATSGIHTSTWFLKALVNQMLLDVIPATRRAYKMGGPEVVKDMPALFAVDYYVANVQFSNVQDEQQRLRLTKIPTSFALEDEQVDDLIAVGQRLVKENPEIKRLVSDMQAAVEVQSGE